MREIATAFGLSHQRVHQIVGGEEDMPRFGESRVEIGPPLPRSVPRGLGRTRRTFDRFTECARRVLIVAQEEARALGHRHVGAEHLLLGLAASDDEVVSALLASAGLGLEQARIEVERLASRGEEKDVPERLRFGRGAKEVLELALREALALGHNYIDVEHLLLALVREEGGVAARILAQHDLDLDRLFETINRGRAA
jgi:ATP-dependent Clp protease ATP-binding subunit ClpC